MLADAIANELPALRAEAEALMSSTCTRRRYTAGAENDYGNPVAGTPVETVYPCRKVPSEGTERKDDREAQVYEASFMLPYDADVIGSDVLVHEGVTWEVLGPPVSQSFPVRLRVTARYVAGG